MNQRMTETDPKKLKSMAGKLMTAILKTNNHINVELASRQKGGSYLDVTFFQEKGMNFSITIHEFITETKSEQLYNLCMELIKDYSKYDEIQQKSKEILYGKS